MIAKSAPILTTNALTSAPQIRKTLNMISRRRKTQRVKRDGTVAVEMAFILPLLFLIVFTSIEFGRMNVIRHTVDNAAYESARRAIVPGVSADDVEAEARRMMRTVGARGVEVTITPAVIDIDTPEINVEVSVRCEDNGFLAAKFFAGKSLVGTCTLRREDI